MWLFLENSITKKRDDIIMRNKTGNMHSRAWF